MAYQMVLGLTAVYMASALPLDPPGFYWQPPTATDQRTPCPFLNTLANHGYIPRSGLDVPGNTVLAGMDTAFNINSSFTIGPVTKALGVSTPSVSGSFNLPDVNVHGLIEHDASFSRHDAGDGDGDGVTFSPSVWGSTARHFTDATISILNVADALRDRVFSESSLDPMFNFTEIPRQTVLNEVATALLMFWGGSEDGGVNTVQVNTFFVDERIPFDKNYVSPASRIFPVNITTVGEKVNASLPLDLPFVPML